jgi:hypothetical protein
MRKPPSIRTLTLVSAGSGLPELRELQRREREDELPRSSLFRHVLNSDILDEHLLQRTPGVRSLLYRSLPTGLAQIVEAYLRMGRYDAIISWAEHLGIPLAGLMKAVRIRPVHVALFSWISKPKKARLLKHVHAQIDRIILWSSVQRDFAIEKLAIPPQKIALMRYYVDQQFWRPFPEQGSDMICSAGREMRDYETLIESLRGSAIPCHIAARSYPGKVDAWMKYLQTLDHPPGNVTVGARSPRELRLLYARSRFVVIPILPTDTDNGVTKPWPWARRSSARKCWASVTSFRRGTRDCMSLPEIPALCARR